MSDAQLKELREQFAYDTTEWHDIRTEGDIDMRYAAGDPWDPKDRADRKAAGRPCISLDELSQYTNQVVNEVRANKRAAKFSPVGNGANDDSASFYADKMREIEYRSRAQIAYTTAFENGVQRSFGFLRVNTRFEHARSVNQDLWIDPIHNPNLVTPDPHALMPDLSDMKHCWVRESWAVDDFNRKWPQATIKNFSTDLVRLAPDWLKHGRVFVGEHWKIKTRKRKLLIVQPAATQPPTSTLGLRTPSQPDPIGIFEDEITGGLPGTLLTTRETDDPTVCQYLTNGLEILEENAWAGKYIPIVGCLGKVIYIDEGTGAKRVLLSMIRLAREPQMLYAYLASCEAELIGMTPKFPYFVYRGQLKPDQLELLQKSLHEPVAVIQIETITNGAGGQVLPHPQRQPYEPPLQPIEIAKEAARRAIQAAMGQTPLPTAAQRRSEKSGVALKHIDELGQRGSFHFVDHYLDMIQHTAVIVEDLMDKIYDTARDVGIRKANDTAEVVRINDPSRPKAVSTKGDHLVTVSTGPSYESEREAASDFADTLASSSPEIFALLGPLIVKLKNLGPIGDEMIELLETMQPPPVQALRASKAKEGDPRQAAQQLMQAKAELMKLSKLADEMKQALQTDAVKQHAQVTKTKIDATTAVRIQRMKDATTIAVAKINALTKGVLSTNEAEVEAIALTHEADQNEHDRIHEAALAQMEHDHALEQGQQAHDQALAQGDAGVQGQLAVQAAAPQPQTGAEA